ncbi:uncharacterized protein LOC123555043 [Mercenaria mercenaria]|uniref:uncharacterized protein LOC123555043 n=1 Tax=Mercenaria mercenaria TaxID=6596 RepID=UPI00234F61B3|nr:uncharacterized protein LOC123555043 [Mercenaria mercenaria]
MPNFSTGAHLGAHLGAPLKGAPQGAPGAHLGTSLGAHLGAPLQGAPQGASGAHLGAPEDVSQGAPGGAPQGALQGGPQEIKPTILQHPFTMMISGPTACGKTTFVKELLQNHIYRIKPGVQRIVWLYKRWQPMYGEIQSTVYPEVKFYQGIPSDINEDEYFDTKLNNLLILDDMMSEAGKDKRITDLFTEGSHHRSLSVISINQNLYASKDPTQRRNCHYLVMFNNPVDKQSMITLARQMYPGKTEYFLKKFEKATKQPYGFLLVDLKPFTPEHARLKYDLMWIDRRSTNNESLSELTNQMTEPDQNCIKGEQQSVLNHLSVGIQTVDIAGNNCEIMAENTNACDDCGLLFDSSHDVQRHVKRGWCAENNDTT